MANLKRPVSDALEWVGSIRTEPNVNQAGRQFAMIAFLFLQSSPSLLISAVRLRLP